MNGTKVTRAVFTVVALVAFLGSAFGLKYLQAQRAAEAARRPVPALPVSATRPVSERWRESLETIGSLRAVNGVLIANEVPGLVEEISFSSGQTVQAGAVLLRLDAGTDRAALGTLLAEEKLARQDFDRIAGLINEKAVSQSDFDAAAARLEAAEARVLEQRARLQKKTIRAPFAGRVGLRLVDQGQFLETGTGIVEIVSGDPIYADFTISELDLPRVQVGNTVAVGVGAYPGEEFRGSVEALDTSVRSTSRTVQVRALLPNPGERLRAGMFARIRVYSGLERDVITVPRTAVSYNTYGEFVYVLEGGTDTLTARRRQVSSGEVRGGRVAIVDGLQGDERIVATGLVRLRNGQAVTVADDGGAGI